MTNSYCGKDCGFCVSRTEGKCIGCKPEVFVPLHESLYISGVENADEKKQIIGESDITSASVPTTDETGTRFSSYCQIAICCRNKKIEGCNECLKSYACDKYMKKGIMNTIIDSRMDAWGMIDHGLKETVPFLYILLVCFIIEALLTFSSINPQLSSALFFVTLIVTGIRAFGYYKLQSFNTDFLTVFWLTVVYIGASLFQKLLELIDYGAIEFILLTAAILIQIASSITCYKISFDAYAELVSPVDYVLENRWKKLWKLTVIFYIIALVFGLLNLKSGGLSFVILSLGVAIAIIDIITFILILATIKDCSEN